MIRLSQALKEEEFSGALVAALNAIPDLPPALKEIIFLFNKGTGGFDEEEVNEAKQLVQGMLEKKRA